MNDPKLYLDNNDNDKDDHNNITKLITNNHNNFNDHNNDRDSSNLVFKHNLLLFLFLSLKYIFWYVGKGNFFFTVVQFSPHLNMYGMDICLTT